MGYKDLGIAPDGVKRSRWKDRTGEHGVEGCWTIASTFGLGGDARKVTLILENHRTGNTFYTKHVLREGENKDTIHSIRNARGALTQAIDHGGTPAQIKRAARIYSASQNAMFLTTARVSTFISLDKIELRLMLYRMAEKLAAVSDRIAIGVNTNVEIDFQKDCVLDSETVASGSTMIVGVEKTADDGGKLTFDVNHCAEGARDYIR